MIDRKGKHTSENENEVDAEEITFAIEPGHVEVGAGYTIAVSHDENERQVIDIKTYGQVDIARLRKEIERTFPNAEIRKFNQSHSLTVVKSNSKKRRSRKK
jgi:5'-deoxynucleotidase YfbR-like HD superfamily hydrolase